MNIFALTISAPKKVPAAHAGGSGSSLPRFEAIFKSTALAILLAPVFMAQTAMAGGIHNSTQSSAQALAEAQYSSTPVECTVMEVATQYESGAHDAEFHCIEEPEDPRTTDGMVFELKGLPADFKERYRRNLKSIDERLEAALPKSSSSDNTRLTREARAIKRKAQRMVRTKFRAENTYRSEDKIILTEDSTWSMSEDADSMNEASAIVADAGVTAEAISVTNSSNVLVLHITALDSQTSASPSELSDSVFGTYGDPVNLASQYDACSYGKKTFVPAQGSDIVDGVAQISIGINAQGASRSTVMNAATTAANNLLGSLSSNFDHVLYVLPPGTADSWIAYGYFNNYRTVYNNDWATKVSAQMHEVGHNLYLQHSNEGSKSYADQQGMMGYSYKQDDTPVMCFNAAKSSQLTWYKDKELTVTKSWTGKVIGLADYDKASSEQNVIIKVKNDGGDTLFVTYNRKSGINSGTVEAGNQVTVVEGANKQESSLLAKLGNNGTYTRSNFWSTGNDFVITVDEIGTDFNNVQYAMVNIANDEASPVYALTVNNGSGDGSYDSGEVASITAAAAPSGQEFDRWVVNSGGAVIANVNAASTTVTMPSSAATVTATYKDQPLATYALTVTNGSGDGSYVSGAVASITAAAAPAGQEFDRWVVNSGGAVIANVNAASTTVTMPSNAAKVTATYKDEPPATYALTVTNGSGDGSYVSGAVASITAAAAPAGQEFDRWVVNSGGAVIANVNAASTTVTMPSNAAKVTATYKDEPPATYTLTVNNGGGDGSYATGAVTNLSANAAPSGQVFSRWVVNAGGAVIANVNAASTTLIMPSNAVTVTATYTTPAPTLYALTVSNGNGDGSYITGAIANITADAAPSGQEFDRWVINSGSAVVTDVLDPSTTLIMPSNAATVTATFKEQTPETFALTVNSGSGDGSYAEGVVANITADAAASGQVFDRWVVNSGGAVIADTSESSTTLIMPSNTATISAEYTALDTKQPKAEQGVVTGVSSSSWTTVNLDKSYLSMVVVATPNYSNTSDPAVVRIRKASGSSFQVKMAMASSGTITDVAVHYLVVEEGVYDSPKMEARRVVSNGTNRKGSWSKSSMEEYNYAQTYTAPVVLGQVLTHKDPGFSVFWASRGNKRQWAPSAKSCYVGKHIAEDTDKTRDSETLGVIVIESGSGTLNGVSFTAGLGPNSIAGVGNSPPYSYDVSGVSNPGTAILSSAAMKGKNGGWPILYGSDPVTSTAINIAVDEDQLRDSERKHGTEKFAYIVLDKE